MSKELATTNSITIRGATGNILLSDYYSASSGSTLIPSLGIGNYTAVQAYITQTIGVQAATSSSTP